MANEILTASRGLEQGIRPAGESGDKRREQRFPVDVILVLQELSATRKTPVARKSIRGIVHNVSKNGIGISTTTPLAYSEVVRCEIVLGTASASIPTIAQVRWVQRAHGGEYRSGLAYLL